MHGLRWPQLWWSGEMCRIGGDNAANKLVLMAFGLAPSLLRPPTPPPPLPLSGRKNDDIGIVALMGPLFDAVPSDGLLRTLYALVDIAVPANTHTYTYTRTHTILSIAQYQLQWLSVRQVSVWPRPCSRYALNCNIVFLYLWSGRCNIIYVYCNSRLLSSSSLSGCPRTTADVRRSVCCVAVCDTHTHTR